jgi:hypothetical protein
VSVAAERKFAKCFILQQASRSSQLKLKVWLGQIIYVFADL